MRKLVLPVISALVMALGVSVVIAVPIATESASATTASSASSFVSQALATVGQYRHAGALTEVAAPPSYSIQASTNTPASSAPSANTTVYGQDSGGKVAIAIIQISDTQALIDENPVGTGTFVDWTITLGQAVPAYGPVVTQATEQHLSLSSAAQSGSSQSAATPDLSVEGCGIYVPPPTVTGSVFGPLFLYTATVVCTDESALIWDNLNLWKYNGGYSLVATTSSISYGSDYPASYSQCYTPWTTAYAYHSELTTTVTVGGATVGAAITNSANANIACDH